MSAIRSFLESYFTNLFIIWEIILFILYALKSISFVDNFRTILWANQGYYVLLVPLTLIEFYYDVMMIKNNKEFFSNIKNDKLKCYTLLWTIGMLIGTDFVLFRVGIIDILTDQFPIVITNNQSYHFWTTIAYLVIYSVIPIGHYVVLWIYKRYFCVLSEFNHNRFKIDLTSGSFIICMSFNFALIVIVIQNYPFWLK